MTARPDHITLLCTDIAKSMAYYGALLPLLGFRERRPQAWSNDAGFHLQFLPAQPGTRPYERHGAGMNHLGFSVATVAQVQRVRDAMAAAGFAVPELQQLDGATALFMRDPDGIRFEISHYPPGISPVD